MKKKLIALLTAIGCVAQCLPGAAFAADSGELELTDDCYIVMDTTYNADSGIVSYMRIHKIEGTSSDVYDVSSFCGCLETALAGEKIPEPGDILRLDWSGETAEIIPCCLHLAPGDTIENLGSAWDLDVLSLTITEDTDANYQLEAENGTVYQYIDPYHDFRETALGEVGDTVEFALYDGELIPLYGTAPVAEDTELTLDFAVVAQSGIVYPAYYVLYCLNTGYRGTTYSLSAETADQYLANVDTLDYGDMIRIKGVDSMTELAGTNDIALSGEMTGNTADTVITRLGTVFDHAELRTYTVTPSAIGNASYAALEYDGREFRYYTDYLDSIPQPSNVNWDSVTAGDAMEFFTFKDLPIVPLGSSGTLDFAVAAVDDSSQPTDYLFYGLSPSVQGYTYKLSAFALKSYVRSDFTLEYGDIVRMGNIYMMTEGVGVNQIQLAGEVTDGGDCGNVTPIGSIYDSIELLEFTVADKDSDFLYLENGDLSYTYCTDQLDSYEQPSCYTSLTTAEPEDTITFYCYDGIPVLPKQITVNQDVPYAKEYVVAAVNNAENPQKYIIHDDYGSSYYLSPSMVSSYLVGDTLPQYGDIIRLTGEFAATELDGTNSIIAYNPTGDEAAVFTIEIIGSVYEENTVVDYTITSVVANHGVWLRAGETTGSKKYYIDYMDTYLQPGGIDWGSVHVNDTVTFVTWNGRPALPTAISGDVYTDGAFDIRDVIYLGQCLMGAATREIPASVNEDPADFNKDGVVNSGDTLEMMRRIVGLA